MRKWFGVLAISLMGPGLVSAQTLEQRVERLEEIASNPVTIQLGQRLDFQASELAQIQDRLDRLLFQNQQLQMQFERYIQQSSQRIAQLEAQLQQGQQTAADSSDSGWTVPALSNDDSSSDADASLAAEQAMLETTETESVEVSTQPVELTFAPDAAGEVGASELLVVTATAPSNVQAAYDEAFTLLGAGEYKLAEQAFEAFLLAYPAENLTADAYYWLGESRLIQQDFGPAFEAFQVIINEFTDHARIENALLRGADSLVGFNDIDQAVGLYQRLIELFPNGRAAQSAQERLNRLRALN